MKIDIITLFPEMFKGPFTESMIKRAQEKGLVKIKTHQLRKWAIKKRGQVDDSPYGGGAGMLMRVDVANAALQQIAQKSGMASPYTILLSPKGKKFDQAMARRLAKKKHLAFLCPHYEGYDHRIESLVDEKVSIGDYILTGGELPAAVIVDAVVRLIPGVIKAESLKEESFSCRGAVSAPAKKGGVTPPLQYEYPQYTRPEIFEAKIKGKKIKKRVPKVLLSGNHALIAKWREKMSSSTGQELA